MDPRLYKAARVGDVSLLIDLIGDDPKILHSMAPEGNTALHIAAKLGNVEFINEILTQCRPLLTQTNSNGDTPLHCAARTGQVDIVGLLIRCGASILGQPLIDLENGNVSILTVTNKEGKTALHEAMSNGHSLTAMKLLEADSTNGNRSKILEEKKELIRIQDNFGRTALHYTASQNNATVAARLLSIDPSIAYFLDKDGLSPLHIAAAAGSSNAIEMLLQHCPDASEQMDPNGRNAVHIAAVNGRVGAVRVLLCAPELKGSVKEPDKEGNTLIHLAAKHQNVALLEFLLEEKMVDLTIKNKAGNTALDIAELQVEKDDELQIKILKLLRHHGAVSSREEHISTADCTTYNNNEQLKCSKNAFMLVATLIAAITFTATFTTLRGYNNNEGPDRSLINQTAFKAFLLSNTVAMCSSISTFVCSIDAFGTTVVSSPTHCTLQWAEIFLEIAVWGMLVSFMTGVYMMAAAECMWLAIVVCLICCGTLIVACASSFCDLKYFLDSRKIKFISF